MFHTITIEPGNGKPEIVRHVPAGKASAENMAALLCGVHRAKFYVVEPIKDKKILAALIARIATLCLLMVLQFGVIVSYPDNPQMRPPRPQRAAGRISRKREDHV